MAVTEQKKAVVAQMKETLSEAKGAVLVSYSGLTVAQVTDLRRKFIAENVFVTAIIGILTAIDVAKCVLYCIFTPLLIILAHYLV